MTEAKSGQSQTTLSSDEWTSSLDMACAHDLAGIDPNTFVGWFDTFSVYGLTAISAGSNIAKVDRTPRHARRDGLEDYSLIFQLSGRSAIDHKDRLLELTTGELVLVDPTRPITVFNEPGVVRHMALHLPRGPLVSHLGFEPKGALHRGNTAANRLLLQLMIEAFQDNAPSPELPEPHMRLVVYDLLAALFAPPPSERISAYTDKLFARICSVIKTRFADTDLTPSIVAAECGISIRYLQKLFTTRGTTCNHYISLVRLEHASRLLQRRSLLKTGEPLGEIAYTCGFLDYAHFSRKFRERFGHPPSAYPSSLVREQTNEMTLRV
jgi:AraC family transcriptional activator of tynA and feaB